ncbi:uncharacterized protein N7484_004304 [Penicillium longicatenatum]|uniref:uncharacterized protein n=1 Tax=Penicillium longicatenatum TaxID=1561947 RepID=UPI00254879D8|nr:uncharacterized protein N7484_004304 [Penicillium longicatenatum]KAJ5650581.1 hypothetical protein N7484_004304 [Penicillium longicatenatum]KAJ5671858.1 hypothetical protein N7507_000985 [Penicillium longicatenatum]
MNVRSKMFMPLRGRVVARSFSVSRPRWEAAPLPTSKPVGAFRGGVFGFLSGAVVAGASVYYYILGDYRVANEMLTDDISALQAATLKLQSYINELESKVNKLQKK